MGYGRDADVSRPLTNDKQGVFLMDCQVLRLSMTPQEQGGYLLKGERSDQYSEQILSVSDWQDVQDALHQFGQERGASSRWVLALDEKMPKDWLYRSWETLPWADSVLGKYALVARGHRWHEPIVQATQQVRYLNLFPKQEYAFNKAFEPWVRQQRLRPAKQINLREDIADCDELFILAHGDAMGLLDSTGKRFALPDGLSWPRTIWLLACAERHDSMYPLAQRLLAEGAQCVVCAIDRLDAPKMAAMVTSRLQALATDSHATVAGVLLGDSSGSMQAVDGGWRCLSVWGELALSAGACAPWNHAQMHQWVHGTSPKRLTDRSSEEDFRHALEAYRALPLWPQTKATLLPELLWLSERRDHTAMLALKADACRQTTPQAFRASAKLARRVGDYVRMASYLHDAFAIPCDDAEILRDLLNLRANLLIDMNLPEAARQDLDQHRLLIVKDPLRDDADKAKRFDAMARIHARLGQYSIALDELHAKTELAKQALNDDYRAHTASLYLLAWGCRSASGRDEAYRKQAEKLAVLLRIRLQIVVPDTLQHANDDALYMARALAAYAWAVEHSEIARLLIPWRAEASKRLSDPDPGPWAYMLLFGALMGLENADTFARALSALQRSAYHLESAVFAALAQDASQCQFAYGRFTQLREATLKALQHEAAVTEQRQRAVLESQAWLHPEHLAQLGILAL